MRVSRVARAGLRHATCAVVGHALASGATAAVATSTTPLRTQARYASSKNPYAVLGIKQGANKAEIKKAYRVLARKHHPDAPGGSDERFREVQEAYEQIKSGVWVRKDQEGSGSDGSGGNANRYSGFRYTTRTHHKSKVSYDQFYEEMHTGRVKKDPFADDDEPEDPAAKDPRRNPFAMNEFAFQAWLRFIIMWCVVFCSLRLVLFLMFPPKWEKPQRKPPPRELRGRKPPPPKPLRLSEDAIVA
ncbi:conserved hypothetical protein [Leishmania mexicana MHOM/GT/2001/U1103]|uniref:J domain-containing protein n=1 Tax=Leishmania mexicana (strain MHOM/GT/2001/U1103) TaxID=929439 RepID=E9ARH0_LEIMU|nr:conserved hypothetical protein [Leishmania mexicana MHOM/GT/2001/U1103]CBZ25541.1 conserved hypothetical protein [Leishmania mexicana MHOM/GT/2001/U1103]